MLTVNNMSKWQSFMWLWRFDSEAKFYWLKCFLLRHNLKDDVRINLSDFGIVRRVDYLELQRDKVKYSTMLEF